MERKGDVFDDENNVVLDDDEQKDENDDLLLLFLLSFLSLSSREPKGRAQARAGFGKLSLGKEKNQNNKKETRPSKQCKSLI